MTILYWTILEIAILQAGRTERSQNTVLEFKATDFSKPRENMDFMKEKRNSEGLGNSEKCVN